MKISYSLSGGKIIFQAEPSEEDCAFWVGKKAKMGRDTASFYLPKDVIFSIHPDAMALAALLVYGPFAAKQVEFGWSVSQAFSTCVKRFFKRSVFPVDQSVQPRNLSRNGRDSLAFSGGVDSVAALALLPEETLPIFMNRIIPEGLKKGLYSNEAALRSCATVQLSGREVVVFDNTMEFARDPVGFSVDWTNAAGAVLLSDTYNIRSIAFGMIAESAFFIGHPHYSDLSERSVYKAWAPLFEVIGLPIALPTAGVSEVVTTKIAGLVSDRWYSQSCVRGSAENPCGSCFKCFRKIILDAKVSNKTLPANHFNIAYSSKEVKRRLLEVPVHHENVLAYSVHGLVCDGEHPVLSIIKNKTRSVYEYGKQLTFVEKFYPRGLDYVPDFLREHVRKQLSIYASEATLDEIAAIEGWEISDLVDRKEYISAQRKLEEELANTFPAKALI